MTLTGKLICATAAKAAASETHQARTAAAGIARDNTTSGLE